MAHASGSADGPVDESGVAADLIAGKRIFGAVFAGGASERMGEAKALLPWPDASSPLVLASARMLSGFCATVEVASGPPLRPGALGTRRGIEAALAGEFECFDDAVPKVRAAEMEPTGRRSLGPLSALTAALERGAATGHDVICVIGCDMPLVTRAEYEPLAVEIASGADVALYRQGEFDQPLCALYRAEVAPAARAALESGARRPVTAFAPGATPGRDFIVARRGPDENSALRLMNVNAPADYDRARNLLHESQGRPTTSARRPDR